MNNRDLITVAAKAIRPHQTVEGRLIGDVGVALLSAKGELFTGVCVDTPSWGLCAERAALAAMITSGEYVIDRIAAVWRKDATGELFVLPPCGHCREFLRNLDAANLEAEIILGVDSSQKLTDLLPEHAWPEPTVL